MNLMYHGLGLVLMGVFALPFSLIAMESAYLPLTSMPPLHEAAQKGDLPECMKIMETNPEQLDIVCGGMTALHYAAVGGYVKIADFLLGHNRTIVNMQDVFGNTALHLAVKNSGKKRATVSENRKRVSWALRYGELVALLIENEADLRVRNHKGRLAIEGAMKRCNIKIIDLLMCSASSEDWESMVFKHMLFWMPSPVEKGDRSNDHLASLFGGMRKSHVRIAVTRNSDAHLDYQNLKMLLYCACLYNCQNLCRLLVEDLQLISKTEEEFDKSRLVDRKLMMLLHVAAELSYYEILRLLLPFYKVDIPTSLFVKHRGFTPLHCAAVAGDMGTVKLLCDHKVPINAKDFVGYTPLHRAAQEGHVQVVEALLDHDADMSEMAEELTTLQIAAVKGRAAVVRLLLKRGADPKRTSESSVSFLGFEQTAMIGGSLSRMDTMDVEPIERPEKGISALQCAAYSGNTETIQYLLNEANVRDAYGNVALHYAIKSGQIEAIRILAAIEGVDTCNDCGRTPLHLACAFGLEDVVKLLLELRANIHKADNQGFLPIHFVCAASRPTKPEYERVNYDDLACEEDGNDVHKVSPYKKNSIVSELSKPLLIKQTDSQKTLIDMLIQYGSTEYVNSMTTALWTPLLLAVSAGNRSLAHHLIQCGAQLNGTTNGYPVLHLALSQGGKKCEMIIETIESLNKAYKINLIELSYRAERERVQRDELSKSRKISRMGHLAADVNSAFVLRALLELGVDVNLQDRDGWTILHRAANKGSEAVVNLLLEFNADASIFSDDGYVPLHLAAKACHLSIMRRLLEGNNADVNIVSRSVSIVNLDKAVTPPAEVLNSRSGYTPLHLLIQSGSEQAAIILGIELLKKKGADINCKTQMGLTPLHLASRNGHEQVVSKLLDLGAEAYLKDVLGNTPLDEAIKNGHEQVVRCLSKRLKKGEDDPQ